MINYNFMDTQKLDISIILPSYNEAKILRNSVLSVKEVMDDTVFKYEIIIVEDGTTDGTAQLARELSKEISQVVHLHLPERRGKGGSIAEAARLARGTTVGFIDADLETPAYYIPILAREIKKGVEIVSVDRIYKIDWELFMHFPKYLMHIGYLTLAKRMLRIPLNDPGSSCKFWNNEKILPLFSEIGDQHWFWDTELITRAYYKGYKTKELSTLFILDWDHESKVKPIQDTLLHLRCLLRLRRELKRMYWKKIKKATP